MMRSNLVSTPRTEQSEPRTAGTTRSNAARVSSSPITQAARSPGRGELYRWRCRHMTTPPIADTTTINESATPTRVRRDRVEAAFGTGSGAGGSAVVTKVDASLPRSPDAHQTRSPRNARSD